MRILFVSRCLPLPLHLGDRLILFHLLRELRDRGHHCTAVALASPGDGGDVIEASRALTDGLVVDLERPRSTTSYLRRLVSTFPAGASGCWQPAVWRAVRHRLEAGDADVVHFVGGIQVYEHRDAARGRPRLIQPYESYSRWLAGALEVADTVRRRLALRLRLAAARAFERRIFVGFDRVVLNTDSDERCLQGLARRLPTTVIPQGVDPGPPPTSVPSRDGARLAFLGNLSYPPNVDAARRLCEEVLPEVRRSVPGATVTLVGADPAPAVLRLRGAAVEVTGTVPEVLPWLRQARVFVSPVRWGAGMKNKVLEAMAAGTPVVATPPSCDGIALLDGVHALVAGSTAELARAAVRVLQDAGLAAGLAAAARRLVEERYSWSSVVSRYEELYRELVEAGTRGSRS